MDKKALYDFIAKKTGKCAIAVVGDVMLDKYYYGEVTRISPEAPVPITHVISQKETLGGAANVAHNLALLGTDTTIIIARAFWISLRHVESISAVSCILQHRRRRRCVS